MVEDHVIVMPWVGLCGLTKSLAVVTMDSYGHLFPSEAERWADRLDKVYHDSLTDIRRTERPELVGGSRN